MNILSDNSCITALNVKSVVLFIVLALPLIVIHSFGFTF